MEILPYRTLRTQDIAVSLCLLVKLSFDLRCNTLYTCTMKKKPGLAEKIVRSLIHGRFDPIETIIALFMVAMGIWITIRERVAVSTTFFGSGESLTATAIVFILIGVIHLVAMNYSSNHSNIWYTVRKNTLFIMTLAMFFATIEVLLGLGVGETRWLIWAALTLVSAATYLALVVKR